MSLGILLLFVVSVTCNSNQTDADNLLYLSDSDFPAIYKKYPVIFAEFVSQESKYCEDFAQDYLKLAKMITHRQINISLAVLNINNAKEIGYEFGVRTFPTFYLLTEAEHKLYTGARTIKKMLFWIQKQLSQPIKKLSKEQYQTLKPEQNCAIVIHNQIDMLSMKQIIRFAALDNTNEYYWGQELREHNEGLFECICYFKDRVNYQGKLDISTITTWIEQNTQPFLVEFDEQTISYIFTLKKTALILFQPNSTTSKQIQDTFIQFSKQQPRIDTKKLLCTILHRQNKHYNNLQKYLQIDAKIHQIVLVEVTQFQKYVMEGEISLESLRKFVEEYKEYGAQLNAKIEQKDKTNEEL